MKTLEIDSYTKGFEVRWSDLDPNRHLKNTAYSEFATNLRLNLLAEKGFSFQKFSDCNLGQYILKRKRSILKK